MANFTPIKTLVELIRTTGWWPSDVPSSLNGKSRGEVVVLDAIAFVDFNHSWWEMHSPTMDLKSLPVSFTRYEFRYVAASGRPAPRWPWQKQRTLEPPHVYVLVADAADRKDINPLSDCCALVPFDEMNRDLDPARRIELAKQAIVVCLDARGAWPYKHPISVADAATRHIGGDSRAITLERGKDAAFNPNDWAEPVPGEAVGYPPIRTIVIEHKPTKIAFSLFVYRDKFNPPLVVDPYIDCAAIISRAALLKARESQKAEGHSLPPLPPDHVIEELARAAMVAFFTSVGAWKPYAKSESSSIAAHPFVKEWRKDSSVITLTPGRQVFFDPDEWGATNAPIIGEPAFQRVLMTHKPTHLMLMVVIYVDKMKAPGTIDPHTDCCFVFSRSYFQETFEWQTKRGTNPPPLPTDDGIKALGREAIAAFLSGLGVTGPFRQKTRILADELRTGYDANVIGLKEVGPATVCPSAWVSRPHEAPEKLEALLGRSVKMFQLVHMPTGSDFMVTIIAVDQQYIDPIAECVAQYQVALKGVDMAALGREAIIVQLHSMGAWPHPVTEISMSPEQIKKADNLALKLAVEEVLSKLDEMKTRWPEYSDMLQNIEAGADLPGLRKLHAHLEGGEVDVSPVARRMRVDSVFARLEKLEHRIEQFEKMKPKMVAQLQGKQTEIRGALQAQFHFQSAIDAFLFMLDERKPYWPPVVIEELEMSSRTDELRSLLARLEDGEIDPQAEMRFMALVSLMRGLEEMDSLDETGWQQAEIRSIIHVLMPRLRRLVFGDATPEERNQVSNTVYPLDIEARSLLIVLNQQYYDQDFDFGSISNAAEQLASFRKILVTFPPHEDDRKWLVGPDQGELPSDDEDEDGMASVAAQS